MSYGKDAGEVSARYRPAGEVPSVTYPSGTHVVFTAPGSATSGQYGLFEWNFTELADIRSSGRTMTDEDWIQVWARHDQYPASSRE